MEVGGRASHQPGGGSGWRSTAWSLRPRKATLKTQPAPTTPRQHGGSVRNTHRFNSHATAQLHPQVNRSTGHLQVSSSHAQVEPPRQ
eukprot:1736794-Rhodomonas_salina.1